MNTSKVAKFGGTSMGQEVKYRHVVDKVPHFDYVVVSAPGKRNSDDTKLTQDLEGTNPNVDRVMERFFHYGASPQVMGQIQRELRNRLERGNPEEIAAFGEWASAKALADSMGEGVKFIDAKKSMKADSNGNVSFRHNPEIGFNGTHIVPGYYYSQGRDIHTFSTGGSDISGAIIARDKGLEYFNFTDSAMMQADPRLIDNPGVISELTYEELRHLTNAGFGIIHSDVWRIMEKGRKTLTVMGTEDDLELGEKTQITNARVINPNESPYMGVGLIRNVTPIFVDNVNNLDFMDFELEKRLFELGTPKITAIGGLGGTTFYFNDLTTPQYNAIRTKFKEVGRLRGDYTPLCGIVLVGRGMKDRKGTLVEIIESTGESIRGIGQDATENNIITFVPETPELCAYKRVYETLFRN